MRDRVGEVDVATMREVLSRFRSALERHRPELDSLNVYPVPDGDTGTNMLLTQRAVMEELDRLEGSGPDPFAEAVARGSLMGARGNSGVILAQVLRGLTEGGGTAEAPDDGGASAQAPDDGSALAQALGRAAGEARRAVARPVEGTALTVLGDAAEAARTAAANGGSPGEVAEAALAEGRRSLRRTTEVLPELRAAGVVDAGGLGLVLLLDALASVLSGHEMTVEVGPAGPVGRSESAAPKALPFRYEVTYLLRGDDTLVPALSDRLDSLGDSVVVVGGDGLYKVHVHTNDPPAVVAAGRRTGQPEMERVVDLEAEVAELCLSGQARAMRAGERQGSALVAVAEGDGMARLLGSLGAVVVREEPGEDTATNQRLAEAIEAAPAESAVVVMRLSDGEIAADAEDAASRSPREVRVVVARSAPQALSAAAAFNPVSSADHNASAMAAAVDAVSVAALIRSRGEASVGDVAAGDWLGVVDGQVKMAGSGADEVAAALLGDLRQAGHEMLTILVGADGSEAEAERMAQTLVERLDGIQVEVHRGDQSECPYLFGLE